MTAMTLFEVLVADLNECVTSEDLDLTRLFETGKVETCEVNDLGDGGWKFDIMLHDGTHTEYVLILNRTKSKR
jgi:hypothetical protein